MNKKVLIITFGIIAVLLIAVILQAINKNKVRYETRLLKKCTITQVVEASGTIRPVNSYSIGSTVSGLMKEIYVDFNSEVKKGQLLALMDTSLPQTEVNKALANLNKAKADYNIQKAKTENNRKTYQRYKNLYERNLIAKSEFDLAESTYQSDVAALESASHQIEQASAAYSTAKTNLSYTRIISPVNGTVISRNIDVGQPVASSFQAPELFVVAQDLKEMMIEVNVSEADIGKVKEGQYVEYTFDGYPDTVLKGKVAQVRISPTTVSNVVTYVVIVYVDNKDLKFMPGMTVNVSIVTHKKDNILCAPNSALKFAPVVNGKIEKYKTQGIWLLKNNKPERYEIEIGLNDDNKTEIISKELKEGDEVITGAQSSKNNMSAKSGPRGMRMF